MPEYVDEGCMLGPIDIDGDVDGLWEGVLDGADVVGEMDVDGEVEG